MLWKADVKVTLYKYLSICVNTIGEKISHLSLKAKEFLKKTSCNTAYDIRFEDLSLPEFWIYIKGILGTPKQATEVLTTFCYDISV